MQTLGGLGLLGDGGALAALLPSFGVHSETELQDLVCSLLLSEVVYKAPGEGAEAALRALNLFLRQFPAGTTPLESVQFSRRGVEHRYMLAQGTGALYVCFMGTKELRDYVADSNLLLNELWTSSNPRPVAATATTTAAPGALAASAHRGFLSRSKGIPIESLYIHARRQGMRLVLCGHSLGGAVAALCMLRLLAGLPRPPPPTQLRCIGFGCPAFGNEALAIHVHQHGWDSYFNTYALPEDPIPRLYLFRPTMHPTSSTSGINGSSSSPPAPSNSVAAAAAAAARQPSSNPAAPAQPAATTAAAAEPAAAPDDSGRSSTMLGAAAEEQSITALNDASQPMGTGTAAGNGSRLAWAASTIAAVAQTARTGASKLVPSYPSFVHFGNQQYLLTTHVSSRLPLPANPANGSPAAPATSAAAAAAATASAAAFAASMPAERGSENGLAAPTQRPSMLAAHRMSSYRARVLSVFQHAMPSNQQEERRVAAPGGWAAWRRRWLRAPQQAQHTDVNVAQLAPAVAVQLAVAAIPPLPPAAASARVPRAPLAAGSSNSNAGIDSGWDEDRNGDRGSPGTWRWQWRPKVAPRWWHQQPLNDAADGSAAAAVETGAVAIAAAAPAEAAAATRTTGVAPAQATVPQVVQVAVHGAGLETCTAAQLRLPSGAVLEARMFNNRAAQEVLETLQEVSGSVEEATGQGGWLPAWLRSRLVSLRNGHSGQTMAAANRRDSRPGKHAAPGLLLEFGVPAGALMQLQSSPAGDTQHGQRGQQHTDAPGSRLHGDPSVGRASLFLQLVTDFGTAPMPLQLSTHVVWLLGPEPALCQAVFRQLLQAAEVQAAAAVAGLQLPRPWLSRLGIGSAPRLAVASGTGGQRAVVTAAASMAMGIGRGARVAVRAAQSLGMRRSAHSGPGSAAGNQEKPAADVAGLGRHAGGAAEEEPGGRAEPLLLPQPQQKQPPGRANLPGRLRQAFGARSGPLAAAAAQRLQGLLPLRLSAQQPSQAHQALALGLTLIDASRLALGEVKLGAGLSTDRVAGSGSSTHSVGHARTREAGRCLELIAAAVRRKGLQRLEARFAGAHAGPAELSEVLAELADAEVAEEDLLIEGRLGPGTQLRRRLSQAGRAARRRVALLRRWPALRDAAHPELLVLVVHADLFPAFLLSPGPFHSTASDPPAGATVTAGNSRHQHTPAREEATGNTIVGSSENGSAQEGAHAPQGSRLRSVAARASKNLWALPRSWATFTAGGGPCSSQNLEEAAAMEMLWGLQRVVSLAAAFGMRVLLAVATPHPLEATARRRLAASVGLDVNLGAVVPVLLAPSPPQEQQQEEEGREPEVGGDDVGGSMQGAGHVQQAQQDAAQQEQQQPPENGAGVPQVGLLQAALYSHASVLEGGSGGEEEWRGQGSWRERCLAAKL